MSFQSRVGLTVVLCGLIFYFFRFVLPQPEPLPDTTELAGAADTDTTGAMGEEKAESGEPAADPAAPTEPAADAPPAPQTPAKAVSAEEHTIASDLLALTVTNATPHEGGLVKSVELRSDQFAGHDTATDSLGLAGHPTLEVSFADEATDFRLTRDENFEVEAVDERSFTVVRRGPDVEIRERLELTEGYEGKLTVAVKNLGASPARHRLKLRARVGVGDSRYDIRRGVCRTPEDVEEETNSDVEEGPITYKGGIAWGGADSKYFTTLVVPEAPVESCVISLEGASPEGEGGLLVTSLESALVEVAPGETHEHVVGLYIGAKELEVLQAYGGVASDSVELEESIDWGVFGGLSKTVGKLLLSLLRWLQSLVGNWGVSILLLTVMVKAITLPLTLKQMSSMKRMKEIQPEIAKIKEKYADDRTKQGQEMQALFSRSGVNPLAGCLPMVVQLPIWFALYSMLLTAVELVHEPFLWLPDLTQQDPWYLLPVALGGMMVLQNRMMPNTMDEAQAKVMRYFMPAIFTVFMLFLPSGLGVYIFTNIVLSVIQTFIQLRTGNKDEAATPAGA